MDISSLEEILAVYGEVITQIVSRPGDRVMPADFWIVETPTSEPSTSDDSACEESEWEDDNIMAIIRGLLSRFSKLPEKVIRGTTSLASMGVDSITAMQIASLARKQGVFVSPVTIIQSTTVHELMVRIHAEHMEESSGSDSTTTPRPAYVEIPSPLADVIRTTMPRHLRQYIEAVYPVSAGMEWMIGAWQNSGGCRYQHAFIQRVRGRMDIRRLEQSWDALLRLHPILRSTFCPVPAFKGNSNHLLAICVLDTLPGNAKRLTRRKLPRLRSEEQALAAEARMSVMHPATAPGMHARLTVLEGRRDTYLLLNLHHFQYGEHSPLPAIRRRTNPISTDAGSLPILIRHLEAIYLGLDFHYEANLGSQLGLLLPTPKKRQIQEKYWREIFPPSWQPSFFVHRSPSQKKTRANYLFRGVISSSRELREVARKSDLTLQAILLAAWARVHSVECSVSEATFGIWHSSRFVTNLALPCLNLLPMRITDTNRPILEVAKALMKDLQRRSGTLEQSRLRDVGRWVGSEGKPMCNVYVNVLHTAPKPDGNPERDRIFEPVKVSLSSSRGDLELTCVSASISRTGVRGQEQQPVERSFRHSRDPGIFLCFGKRGTFLIGFIQDDVMIEIFFDNVKNSIGMSIESSILTETQSKRLVSEWGKIVADLIPGGKKNGA